MSRILSAFVAMFIAFFVLAAPAPAFAQDASSILTPLYGVGSAEVVASSAAAEICRG